MQPDGAIRAPHGLGLGLGLGVLSLPLPYPTPGPEQVLFQAAWRRCLSSSRTSRRGPGSGSGSGLGSLTRT